MNEWMMAHPWMFFFIVLGILVVVRDIAEYIAETIMSVYGTENEEGENNNE